MTKEDFFTVEYLEGLEAISAGSFSSGRADWDWHSALFSLFPNQFDLSLAYVAHLIALNGQTFDLPRLTLPAVIAFGLIFVLAAPLVIVNHIAAFGEEVGWRGFLLPLLMEELGVKKAVLLDGVLWGIVHAPLVCFPV